MAHDPTPFPLPPCYTNPSSRLDGLFGQYQPGRGHTSPPDVLFVHSEAIVTTIRTHSQTRQRPRDNVAFGETFTWRLGSGVQRRLSMSSEVHSRFSLLKWRSRRSYTCAAGCTSIALDNNVEPRLHSAHSLCMCTLYDPAVKIWHGMLDRYSARKDPPLLTRLCHPAAAMSSVVPPCVHPTQPQRVALVKPAISYFADQRSVQAILVRLFTQ
jgi:hypothetical protein